MALLVRRGFCFAGLRAGRVTAAAAGFGAAAGSGAAAGFGAAIGPFTGYERFSPPLVFNPTGTAEQFHAVNLKAAQEAGPVKVVDGASCVGFTRRSICSAARVTLEMYRKL